MRWMPGLTETSGFGNHSGERRSLMGPELPLIYDLSIFEAVTWWCYTEPDFICGLAIMQHDPFRWLPIFQGWLL